MDTHNRTEKEWWKYNGFLIIENRKKQQHYNTQLDTIFKYYWIYMANVYKFIKYLWSHGAFGAIVRLAKNINLVNSFNMRVCLGKISVPHSGIDSFVSYI